MTTKEQLKFLVELIRTLWEEGRIQTSHDDPAKDDGPLLNSFLESMEEILSCDNSKCPVCGHDDFDGAPWDLNGSEASQTVTCNRCGSEWDEIYTFAIHDNIKSCVSDGHLCFRDGFEYFLLDGVVYRVDLNCNWEMEEVRPGVAVRTRHKRYCTEEQWKNTEWGLQHGE